MTDKVDITLRINGRDHAIRVEPRKTLVDAIREDCGLDRHAYRLRAWRVRRLHGNRRRRGGALLPDVRGAGARKADPHRRGAGQGRHAASDAARLHGASRVAMRLLHAGLPDAGGQRAGAKPGHRRRGVARSCCRRTFAAAPAIRTSSRRSGRAQAEMRPAEATPVAETVAPPPSAAPDKSRSEPAEMLEQD